MLKVSGLSIAPVKALALTHPNQVRVEPFGIAENRRFYLVDADGSRVSGPKHGRLMQVRSAYDDSVERLRLTFPDGTVVEDDASRVNGSPVASDFWGRTVRARVVEGPFGPALSEWYGRPLRLVRPDSPGEAADVQPLSLLSTASAEALSRWSGGNERALDTRRFRLNVEVSGGEPFQEDTWIGRSVRVGDTVLRIPGPIPRCAVTTYHPDTGERDFGTLKAIKDVRGISPENKLYFGVYANVEQPGTIRLGDKVEPIA